jgi:hypothetical protein
VVGLKGEMSKVFSKFSPLSGLKIIPARPSLVSSISLQKIACILLFQKLSCSSRRFCRMVRLRSCQEFGAMDTAFPVDGLCFTAPRLSNLGVAIFGISELITEFHKIICNQRSLFSSSSESLSSSSLDSESNSFKIGLLVLSGAKSHTAS